MEKNPVEPDIIVEPDTTYTFQITEDTLPTYHISPEIMTWITNNLMDLTDNTGNTIFGRVNTGYNESTLKTFGKYPVCDVYINKVDYDRDFDFQSPVNVHTIIIFYLKGANNHTYSKVCELHDYIMQQFLSNPEWQTLDGVVKDTNIESSRLMTQPINKKWSVMGAFELTHKLYR